MDMLVEVLNLVELLTLEGAHALEHLIPVDKRPVKLRPVYADELCLPAYCQTAGSAHAGAIDHDGVEGDIGRDAVLLCRKAGKLHHYRRTDGEGLVNVLLLYELLHADSHDTFLSA